MNLSCSVSVGNRLLPSSASNAKKKHVSSTLSICKKPKSSEYYMILFSAQNKNGKKYEVKNVGKVFSRFVRDGKATIQFEAPQHDLYIQADSTLLKCFLIILKQAKENTLPNSKLMSSISVTPIKPGMQKLIVEKPSDYPSKGFPRSLKSVSMDNMNFCILDEGILKLNKLRDLSLCLNKIERFPEKFGNLCLTDLNLSSNCLGNGVLKDWKWLNGNISKSLKSLDLRNNSLKYLPHYIIKLVNLRFLYIDRNELKQLPYGIGNLTNLTILNASRNFLTYLPSSMRKLYVNNLDLTGNESLCLPCNRDKVIQNLPMCSLREYASRRVVKLRLPYSPETIPYTVVEDLENAKYCICGSACLDSFIKQQQMVHLSTFSRNFTVASDTSQTVRVESYYCSTRCFRIPLCNRDRQPVRR